MVRKLYAAGFNVVYTSPLLRAEGCITAIKHGVRVTLSWRDHTHRDGRRKIRLRWYTVGALETASVDEALAAVIAHVAAAIA